MKKRLFFLSLMMMSSMTGNLRADALNPYGPETSATWCPKPQSQADKATQKAKNGEKRKGLSKKVIVITTLALVSLLVLLGGSSSGAQDEPIS